MRWFYSFLAWLVRNRLIWMDQAIASMSVPTRCEVTISTFEGAAILLLHLKDVISSPKTRNVVAIIAIFMAQVLG